MPGYASHVTCTGDGLRERQETVVGHVHGEIDQDIDAVLANLFGKVGVIQRQHVVPCIGGAAMATR